MDIVDENVSKLNVSEKDPLKSLRLIKDSELYFSKGEWRAYQSTKDQSFSHFVYEVWWGTEPLLQEKCRSSVPTFSSQHHCPLDDYGVIA